MEQNYFLVTTLKNNPIGIGDGLNQKFNGELIMGLLFLASALTKSI